MLDGFADLITYVIYPAFSPGITDILPLLTSPFLASLIISLIATFSILSLPTSGNPHSVLACLYFILKMLQEYYAWINYISCE